ncbi:ATP synthase complex subunit H-domain-containing protein [Phellopilus nigrolimitatus]|nr:ATP synthase complex subunit H-domain-containing protein [Phellopilus nigrolimitatus]
MSAILKSSSRLARLSQRRCISSSPVSRKDIVQDLYLSQLRTYKPPVQAKDAHVGVVKSFHAPAVPKVPSVPADLASALSEYDSAEPTPDAAPTPASSDLADDTGAGAKEFLAFLEADLPKHEAHH